MTVRACLLGLLLSLVGLGNPLAIAAQEDATEAKKAVDTAYDALWAKVAKSLGKREYAQASVALRHALQDPNLAAAVAMITADDQDAQRLERLKKLVQAQCRKLTAGDALTIGGVQQQFVRFVRDDAKGEYLIVKSRADAPEREYYLDNLPAKTWLDLVEGYLPKDEEARYLKGLFHAADNHGDRTIARRLLAEAAMTTPQAQRWLERLDAASKAAAERKLAEKNKAGDKKPQEPAEPYVVSTWAHQVTKDGNIVLRSTFKLYSNGRINGPLSGATWMIRGNLIIFTWPNANAPGGAWKDVCNLSSDKRSYLGKNQKGATITGTKLKDGE